MKNFSTLVILLGLIAIGTQAQNRKTWDFTKGFSATTIANLEADADNWTQQSGNGRVWAESKARTADTELMCKVNGTDWVIPETKGLIFSGKSAKHINVVYDGGTDYTHIWLNGAKAEDAITIPGVAAGEKLTVTFSPHGDNADRGFKVSTPGVADAEGNTVFASSGQSTVVLYNNNTETVSVKLTANVGGMHFYFIQIGDGDDPVAANVAYIHEEGSGDAALAKLRSRDDIDVTSVDLGSQSLTAPDLQTYDAVVISPTATASHAGILREALPWTPMLNLNAQLYAAWGYGESVETTPLGIVKDTKSPLLSSLTDGTDIIVIDGESTIQFSNAPAAAIVLGDYFRGDAVPVEAFEGEAFIHCHNITHNGYVYLPYNESATNATLKLIDNALSILISSKAEITAAAPPKLTLEYKDLNTNIIMTPPNLPKAEVYYTLDGSEPTTQSTLYTGPVNVVTECTVKAVAIAEGYTLSSVAEMVADIRRQPKTPVISYEQQEGLTLITLTCESADADVWYNFGNTTDTLKSSKYTGVPVTIKMPQTVTAFAVTGGEVFSEPATLRVLVKNPRVLIDVAAHYSAPQWTADNNPGHLDVPNGKGMFSWGASAASMYIGEGTTKTQTDPETGEEIEVTVYTDDDLRDYEVVNEPGDTPAWAIWSRGEAVLWQNISPDNSDIGNNEGGYHPMTAEDVDSLFPVTKYDVQFYKVYAGQEPNAFVRTLDRYEAPMDVVVLANMQGGTLEVQVSADGEQWTTIGNQITATGMSRLWKKYTCSFDEEGHYYVRLAHVSDGGGAKVFDIYVANAGEKSQALLDEINQELGIGPAVVSHRKSNGIYNLSGMRLSGIQRGLNIVVGADGSVRKMLR